MAIGLVVEDITFGADRMAIQLASLRANLGVGDVLVWEIEDRLLNSLGVVGVEGFEALSDRIDLSPAERTDRGAAVVRSVPAAASNLVALPHGTSASSPHDPAEPTTGDSATGAISITHKQALFTEWTAFLLADVVVLNLLVEFVPSIVIDSFYISILTAIFLRLLLEVAIQLEHRVAAYVRATGSQTLRVIGRLAMFLILFTSKLVILELVDIVFGNHVDLGGFFEIIAIAIALMAVEYALQWVFAWLGRQ